MKSGLLVRADDVVFCTFETCRAGLKMFVVRGEPEVFAAGPNVENDPTATLAVRCGNELPPVLAPIAPRVRADKMLFPEFSIGDPGAKIHRAVGKPAARQMLARACDSDEVCSWSSSIGQILMA